VSVAALLERAGDRAHEHAPLGARTTYRVGGTARVFLTLSHEDEFEELGPLMLDTLLPIVCVGNGSNLLVADGEHELLAVHLVGDLATMSSEDVGPAVKVTAGAGLDMPVAARRLAHDGVVGLEWAVGVPGTFGGAVAMNAGGHGSDLAASILEATIWRDGTVGKWSKERLALGYRTSALEPQDIVLSVQLSLARGDASQAQERVRAIVRWRREHQPGGQNAGSVFRNPTDDVAARLIEAAGCKGLRFASAQVSEKHANFIQADPDGSANDVYILMGVVRERVRETSGVTLLTENRFLGFGEVA
jgi:UDP-N-acetylmuramate dehydrogenase